MTITIDVPNFNKNEYTKLFKRFVANYSIQDISKIEEELFYDKMLNWVFEEEIEWEVEMKWNKVSLKNLI